MKATGNLLWGVVPLRISKGQAEGAGMAFTLIVLLMGYYSDHELYYRLAIPSVFIVMIVPMVFYPFAVVWFTFSNLLALVMPKIVFTGIYLIILLPVAMVRKYRGYDPFLERQWKKGTESVMRERDHLFSSADLQKPY